MVTKIREWPTNAKEARDRAAEELQNIVNMLHPLVKGNNYDRTEALRRTAEALASAHNALRHLERAGAQTKPN
jgi:hypothetical protein